MHEMTLEEYREMQKRGATKRPRKVLLEHTAIDGDVERVVTLTTPIPPSLNNAYADGSNGRRVLSKKGGDFKNHVALLLMEAGYRPVRQNALIRLSMRLWFATRRRRDITNCVKLLEDALSDALLFDDCNVVRACVERAGYDALNPRCEVVLEVLA